MLPSNCISNCLCKCLLPTRHPGDSHLFLALTESLGSHLALHLSYQLTWGPQENYFASLGIKTGGH